MAIAATSCAPAAISRCTIARASHGSLSASVTLSNRSVKRTRSVEALISAPLYGNRLFAFDAYVLPGASRVLRGTVVDEARYDFKDSGNAQRGCELESVEFDDGSTWDQPSPL